jgi:hypothetical protein
MMGWTAQEMLGKPQHALIHHSRPGGEPYPRSECPSTRRSPTAWCTARTTRSSGARTARASRSSTSAHPSAMRGARSSALSSRSTTSLNARQREKRRCATHSRKSSGSRKAPSRESVPAAGDQGQPQLRGDHRAGPGHDQGQAARRAGRCDRRHGAHSRRDRRGQGALCARHPQPELAQRTAAHQGELRGTPVIAHRERTVRSRKGAFTGATIAGAQGASSWPTAAPSSSMRSANSRSNCRPSSFG